MLRSIGKQSGEEFVESVLAKSNAPIHYTTKPGNSSDVTYRERKSAKN